MKKDTLLDGDKSLTDVQIGECLTKFTVLGDVLSKQLPQTEFRNEDEENGQERRIQFVPKSERSNNGSPSIYLNVNESCSGFEKLKTVTITVNNCGLCRGTKSQKFNSTNISKFEKTLILARNLYEENYHIALTYDKEQVAFDEQIEEVKKTLNLHQVSEPNENSPKYPHVNWFIHHHRGEFGYDREHKNFTIELKRLSLDQAKKLGIFLKSL